MDVKPPLNLAEPCQHDGHQEGLLCFDQHQSAWEHVPDRCPCQQLSAPAEPQEPERDLTHPSFCPQPQALAQTLSGGETGDVLLHKLQTLCLEKWTKCGFVCLRSKHFS